jgi:hypothetical protein
MGSVEPSAKAGPDDAWPRGLHPRQQSLDQLAGRMGIYPRPLKIPRIVSLQADDRRSTCCSIGFHDKPGDLGCDTLTKRARVEPKYIARCKGQCPKTGWSIDQYCEACHG